MVPREAPNLVPNPVLNRVPNLHRTTAKMEVATAVEMAEQLVAIMPTEETTMTATPTEETTM